MKISCGILVYRILDKNQEYFLVRPGGPFYKNLDLGIWTIPKGLMQENETEIETAKREFQEETGQCIEGNFDLLDRIKLRKSKKLIVFSVEGNVDASIVESNLFEMEYPKKSGVYCQFPEIEEGRWFKYKEAKQKIQPKLVGLLEQLEAKHHINRK